jgi:hypothetical protein
MSIARQRSQLALNVQQHAAEARALVEKTIAEAVDARHDIGTIASLNRAAIALTRAIRQSQAFQRRQVRKADREDLRARTRPLPSSGPPFPMPSAPPRRP